MILRPHVDPRLLPRKDLVDEHMLVHALIKYHGQVKRFKELALFPGDRGLSLLILRHELLRVGMCVQLGVRRHGRDEHRSPVDVEEMSERQQAILLRYERHALPLRWIPDPHDEDAKPYRPNREACLAYWEALIPYARFPAVDKVYGHPPPRKASK